MTSRWGLEPVSAAEAEAAPAVAVVLTPAADDLAGTPAAPPGKRQPLLPPAGPSDLAAGAL
jgi:hypothetical protein